jgi:hypothetical protein
MSWTSLHPFDVCRITIESAPGTIQCPIAGQGHLRSKRTTLLYDKSLAIYTKETCAWQAAGDAADAPETDAFPHGTSHRLTLSLDHRALRAVEFVNADFECTPGRVLQDETLNVEELFDAAMLEWGAKGR